jgi:hypothetical protein
MGPAIRISTVGCKESPYSERHGRGRTPNHGHGIHGSGELARAVQAFERALAVDSLNLAWRRPARPRPARRRAAHYHAHLARRVISQTLAHDSWWRVPVLLRLAAILEEEGQEAAVTTFASQAAQLWRHADPELAARAARHASAR